MASTAFLDRKRKARDRSGKTVFSGFRDRKPFVSRVEFLKNGLSGSLPSSGGVVEGSAFRPRTLRRGVLPFTASLMSWIRCEGYLVGLLQTPTFNLVSLLQ